MSAPTPVQLLLAEAASYVEDDEFPEYVSQPGDHCYSLPKIDGQPRVMHADDCDMYPGGTITNPRTGAIL